MDLGLFQLDAAKHIGVSVCTITNWELGHTKPKVHYEPEIARFLEHVSHTDGGANGCRRADGLQLGSEPEPKQR